MSPTTKEKLIRSAYELFYRQGFHGVGLDQIIRSAGVTKTTFYNHFDSKETLILEVMKWRNGIWPEHLRETLRARACIRPRAQLMALFDVLDEVWGTDGYHGCLFIRAAAEFPLLHDPVHIVAQKFVHQLASAIRELAAFAQFASDLDRSTRAQLERGLRSQEVLKQAQFQPYSLPKEVTIIYALTNGFLDDVPIDKVRAWEAELHRFMETAHPELLETIQKDKALSDETIASLRGALDEFKKQVVV